MVVAICDPTTNCLPALKNADDMLKDVVRAVDTNGDGVIQYDGMQDCCAGAPGHFFCSDF